jgi:biotin carboxylase
VVEHALDSLGVRFGASHSEVKVDADGAVKIIEIGSRMGGDCIGSHLVPLSCGYDYVGAVIDVALGVEPRGTCAVLPPCVSCSIRGTSGRLSCWATSILRPWPM